MRFWYGDIEGGIDLGIFAPKLETEFFLKTWFLSFRSLADTGSF